MVIRVTFPSSPGSSRPSRAKVDRPIANAMTPHIDAATGLRATPRMTPKSQNGFAYQANTPAKMPDHPTARAFKPHMIVLGPALCLNSSAGRQQAITNRPRLIGSVIFTYSEIIVGRTSRSAGDLLVAQIQSGF